LESDIIRCAWVSLENPSAGAAPTLSLGLSARLRCGNRASSAAFLAFQRIILRVAQDWRISLVIGAVGLPERLGEFLQAGLRLRLVQRGGGFGGGGNGIVGRRRDARRRLVRRRSASPGLAVSLRHALPLRIAL
jgi:hypothetical protein